MTSNSKSCMGIQLMYLHLISAHSKGQGQDHAHFDNKYLGNVTDMDQNVIDIKCLVMYVICDVSCRF